MLAYILLVLTFVGFIMVLPMLPRVVRAAQSRLGMRGGVAFVEYLEEHMPADLLRDEPEEAAIPEELEELTGGTHFPEEYRDVVDMTIQPGRTHELPLVFFKDFSSYHKHKALAQHKSCSGVHTLDSSFDEVVVYHINSTNPLAELLGLVIQAKNEYIPHPSLNLSDSFNLDRAFVVVMFTGNAPHKDFLQYLEFINNLHSDTQHRRFIALHNDLQSSMPCSALHLPHKDYYIVLNSQMATSQLPQSGTTHFKMIPWTNSTIHRYVVQERAAPHVDLYSEPAAEPPATPLARMIANIPESLYHKEFLRCEDLFRDGVPLAQQLEFHRARESALQAIVQNTAHTIPAGEHLLIHVLGEQFSVASTIGLLTALCRTHRVLVVPPANCTGHEVRNKLCALELWCRSTNQQLLGYTTHCQHVLRGNQLYCLCCAPCHGDALHIYFHPKEPVHLPHLAYRLQPIHSLTYVFKE